MNDLETALDAMPCTRAPDLDTPADRILYATRAWQEEREESSRYAAMLQETHDVLDAAGVPREGTPAERIRRWLAAT